MKVISLKARWLFKYLVFVPVFVIIVLNLELISQIRTYTNSAPDERHIRAEIEKFKLEINYAKVKAQNVQLNTSHKVITKSDDLNAIRQLIEKSNRNPVIRNKHFIEALLAEENKMNTVDINKTSGKFSYKPPRFFVIIVQIHARLNYLKELIASLKAIKHIEETLVIFSHDIYDPLMNQLIQDITFCAVKS